MSFKFNIEDLVVTKVSIEECRLRAKTRGDFGLPLPGMIIERVQQECHGGTQRFYLVSKDGEVVKLTEMELVAYKDVNYEELLDLAVTGKTRRRTKELAAMKPVVLGGEDDPPKEE